MANSADPDQTAPQEQSDQDLHCLLMHVCPNCEYKSLISQHHILWALDW